MLSCLGFLTTHIFSVRKDKRTPKFNVYHCLFAVDFDFRRALIGWNLPVDKLSPRGRQPRFGKMRAGSYCPALRAEFLLCLILELGACSQAKPWPETLCCSWARHLTDIVVPLFTHMYRWVAANLMLGIALRWTSIPSWGGGGGG